MENFGLRLKTERERLGLTQEEFAKACGVGRTAQFNYEREERSPSSEYLEAANLLGADSTYIMTGTRRGDDWVYAKAYKGVLDSIESVLDLDRDKIDEIVSMKSQLENSPKAANSILAIATYNTAVSNWLKSTKRIEGCIDVNFFTSILALSEDIIQRNKLTITPQKKSNAIVMLYQMFKKSGLIEQAIIENTLQLAAS